VPKGPRTQATLRNNIAVCIRYMAAWIGGTGCVPLYNLMEDAATAEISRAQVGGWFGGQVESAKQLIDCHYEGSCVVAPVQAAVWLAGC
jgi:malate synthase